MEQREYLVRVIKDMPDAAKWVVVHGEGKAHVTFGKKRFARNQSEHALQTLNPMTEIEEEIQTTDEAFLSASTPKYLDGIKLEPLSLMRQTIGMELSGPESSAFFDCYLQDLVVYAGAAEVLSDPNRPRLSADPGVCLG